MVGVNLIMLYTVSHWHTTARQSQQSDHTTTPSATTAMLDIVDGLKTPAGPL